MIASSRITRLVGSVAVLSCLMGSAYAQAPAPAAAVNPASNIPPGLANSGVAQGSIFVIYGANMGPTSLVQATSLPLPTTAGLAGTSVTVTVNGTTVTAPMIYSFATQVAAILPSTTPVGTGTLSVKFNGAIGSTPITVVASNFGISTVDQSGTGPAVVTFADYSLVTSSKSTKPGDTLILWGTGLGATSGSDAILPIQKDFGAPIQVFVGGVRANVVYGGRSASPGLDQINFVVPSGVSGCNVSLSVLTGGNIVSNVTSIAIAANGGSCSDPNTSSLTSFSSLSSKSSVTIGAVALEYNDQVSSNGSNNITFTLQPQALFLRTSPSQFAALVKNFTSPSSSGGTLGSCTVVYNTNGFQPSGVSLDAGGSVGINPPSGSLVSLNPVAPGFYQGTLSSESAGTYKLSNGSGGKDIGAFTANFIVAQPITWTNQSNASVITRANGLPITWTGGDANGYVTIDVYAQPSSAGNFNCLNSSGCNVDIQCAAPAAAGQFTVPPSILQALPAGWVGAMEVGTGTNPQALPVPGMDIFLAVSNNPIGGVILTSTSIR